MCAWRVFHSCPLHSFEYFLPLVERFGPGLNLTPMGDRKGRPYSVRRLRSLMFWSPRGRCLVSVAWRKFTSALASSSERTDGVALHRACWFPWCAGERNPREQCTGCLVSCPAATNCSLNWL